MPNEIEANALIDSGWSRGGVLSGWDTDDWI